MVFVRNKEEFRHYDSAGGSSNATVAKELMNRLQPYLHGALPHQTSLSLVPSVCVCVFGGRGM